MKKGIALALFMVVITAGCLGQGGPGQGSPEPATAQIAQSPYQDVSGWLFEVEGEGMFFVRDNMTVMDEEALQEKTPFDDIRPPEESVPDGDTAEEMASSAIEFASRETGDVRLDRCVEQGGGDEPNATVSCSFTTRRTAGYDACISDLEATQTVSFTTTELTWTGEERVASQTAHIRVERNGDYYGHTADAELECTLCNRELNYEGSETHSCPIPTPSEHLTALENWMQDNNADGDVTSERRVTYTMRSEDTVTGDRETAQ